MSEVISALGVQFDLSQSHQQTVFVKNTEKRIADVCGQIADALKERIPTAHAASSLKGRLGFAEGQLFGRSTRRLLNELGSHALAPPRSNRLSESTLFALATVADRMVHAKPRMVEASSGEVFFSSLMLVLTVKPGLEDLEEYSSTKLVLSFLGLVERSMRTSVSPSWLRIKNKRLES